MVEWCVNFPKEQVLMSRPSLRKACGGNRNAAKFLSYLLYRVSARENAKIEAERINDLRKQQGLEPNQDTSTSICRTQPQIVEEMDEELSERTLRDDAIPCLKELGYLTTEEIKGNRQFTIYTLDVDAVQEAINHPKNVPNFETLPYFQKLHGKRKAKWQRQRNNSARKQLRSETLPDGPETIPHGSETLPDGHAQGSGNNSAPKNGTEDSLQAGLEDVSEAPKNIEESNTKITLQESTSSRALDVDAHAPEPSLEKTTETLIDVQANLARLQAQLSSEERSKNNGIHTAHTPSLDGGIPDGQSHGDISHGQEILHSSEKGADDDGQLISSTYRQVGKNGVTSVTFDEITQAQQTLSTPSLQRGGAVRNRSTHDGSRAPDERKLSKQRNGTQAPLPPPPKFSLTDEQAAFWTLWCNVWFNRDIPPDLTETAYKHVGKLAPHIRTAEQLDSLIDHAKKDLEASQGIRRKAVQLGNLVNSYPGWKQAQPVPVGAGARKKVGEYFYFDAEDD